jgi:hypothetical protein
MKQIHVVIRRVSPALKVDFVQVGYIKDDQFQSLHLDALARTPVSDYVEHSSISASPYIEHRQISSLVEALIAYPDFSIDFFDNTLVLMFSTDLTHDESASKEEGKRH